MTVIRMRVATFTVVRLSMFFSAVFYVCSVCTETILFFGFVLVTALPPMKRHLGWGSCFFFRECFHRLVFAFQECTTSPLRHTVVHAFLVAPSSHFAPLLFRRYSRVGLLEADRILAAWAKAPSLPQPKLHA